MSRRLTDIDVWKTSWFRKLPPEYKSFWYYLNSHCDIAGVWAVDFELASFTIGAQLEAPLARNLFSKEIIFLEESKWLLKDYVKTQNGDSLSPKSPIHRRILQLLQKHNIDYQKLKEIGTATLEATLDPRVVLIEGLILKEELILEEELVLEVKKEKALILPLNSDAFSNAWQAWTYYKESQHKFRYKTIETEQIAMKELAEKASNHEQTAIKIIQQSIANGWKGFFELKTENNNGKQNSKNNDQSGEAVKEWFKRKYGV